MERKDTGKNILIAFLIIIAVILSGLLVYNYIKQMPNGNDNEVADQENDDISIQELSLSDEAVVKIIDKFGMDYKKYPYWYIEDVYVREELDSAEFLRLALNASQDLMKTEGNCDANKGTLYDGDGYGYTCKYIEYDDFNKKYYSLAGKNLAKENLYSSDLNYLLYDNTNDIYRVCIVYGGGGSSLNIISKIDKAYKTGDYIFIYEKVAVKGYTGSEDLEDYIYPVSKTLHIDHTDLKNSQYVTFVTGLTDEEIINQYVSKYNSYYKWTFKKNANGEYSYESLQYVSNE